MENSFLKDAINRIVELATPFTLETRERASVLLRRSASRSSRRLNSRHGTRWTRWEPSLVKLIRTEGVAHAPQLYVRVDSARRVVVDSYLHAPRLRRVYSRLPLYEAVSDEPSISVNQ